MKIIVDDLTGKEIAHLLNQHLQDMRSTSPPESKHALDFDALRGVSITFWSIWDGQQLAGCIALKEHNSELGEIKSMKTANSYTRQGVATLLLQHLITESKARGYKRLSLETGSMKYFEPARRFYLKHGFNICEPFANYRLDNNSTFMTLKLKASF